MYLILFSLTDISYIYIIRNKQKQTNKTKATSTKQNKTIQNKNKTKRHGCSVIYTTSRFHISLYVGAGTNMRTQNRPAKN